MLVAEELKENMLITLRGYYFILTQNKNSIASIESVPYGMTSTSLILLKKIQEINMYTISVWLCFCCGKLITYQILKSDLDKLSIYDFDE